MVRVVVKRKSGVNLNDLPPGMTSSILDNEDKNYFEMSGENEESKMKNSNNLSRQMKLKKLSQVLGNLSVWNISNVSSPVIVETSLVVGGFAIKEEVNPFEAEDVKLAFTSTANMWIGILLVLVYLLLGSATGPITLCIKAKSPLIKALWRTQANFIMTMPLYFGMYIWNKKDMSIRRDHTFKMILNSAITSIFDFFWYIGWIIGISMTITSHAFVMYSSTNVYMFVFCNSYRSRSS